MYEIAYAQLQYANPYSVARGSFVSFQAMSWATRQKVGGPIGKSILIMLANYANAEGECFPSHQRIADDCECDRRTVLRWMRNFDKLGLLERERRRRKDGTQTSDFITLKLSDFMSPGKANQSDTSAYQGDFVSKQSDTESQQEPITYPITQPVTFRPVLENGKVKVHRDDAVFSEHVRIKGKSPFTDNRGYAYLDANLVIQLEEGMK